MHMKIGKLTIGDYVSVGGKVVKVASMYSAGIHYQEDGKMVFASSETLEPILITIEFLEKNEFKKCGEHYIMVWCENYSVLATKVKDTLWTIHIQGDSANMDGGVTCVHELQNAMKVCGIEKKIEI